jgi:cytochrome P450
MTTETATRPGHPYSDADPFSDATLTNPYPMYAMLRELGPVVRLERYGAWAMARHAEVYAALGDFTTYCSSGGVGISNFHTEKPWRPPSLILEADPPLHPLTRAVLARVLSSGALRRLRETFERRAAELVERLVERRTFDAIDDCAAAFPLDVFPDAVGLSKDGRENLSPYGNAVFNANGPNNAHFASAMSDAARVGPWILEQSTSRSIAVRSLRTRARCWCDPCSRPDSTRPSTASATPCGAFCATRSNGRCSTPIRPSRVRPSRKGCGSSHRCRNFSARRPARSMPAALRSAPARKS